MNVVVYLVCDPGLNQPYWHREFLTENAKFKEVMSICHSKPRQKIYQTYRVQYICGILLISSKFQESCLFDLTNFIFFNKIEIDTVLQECDMFLLEIFDRLKDNIVGDKG